MLGEVIKILAFTSNTFCTLAARDFGQGATPRSFINVQNNVWYGGH